MNDKDIKQNESKTVNIFERNPKKTIVFTVLSALIIFVFGFEKYLVWRNQGN